MSGPNAALSLLSAYDEDDEDEQIAPPSTSTTKANNSNNYPTAGRPTTIANSRGDVAAGGGNFAPNFPQNHQNQHQISSSHQHPHHPSPTVGQWGGQAPAPGPSWPAGYHHPHYPAAAAAAQVPPPPSYPAPYAAAAVPPPPVAVAPVAQPPGGTIVPGTSWMRCIDPESKDTYFWNVSSGETTWDTPAEVAALSSSSASSSVTAPYPPPEYIQQAYGQAAQQQHPQHHQHHQNAGMIGPTLPPAEASRSINTSVSSSSSTTTTTATATTSSTQPAATTTVSGLTTKEAFDILLKDIEDLAQGKGSSLFQRTVPSAGRDSLVSWQPSTTWIHLSVKEQNELGAQVADALVTLGRSTDSDVLVARWDDVQTVGGLSIELFKQRLAETLEKHRRTAPKTEEKSRLEQRLQNIAAAASAKEEVKAESEPSNVSATATETNNTESETTSDAAAAAIEVKKEKDDDNNNESKAKEETKKDEEQLEDGEIDVLASLPAGTGTIVKDSLMAFAYPETDMTVPVVQSLLLDREIKTIRILGAGFAVLSFLDENEAEQARNVDDAPTDGRVWVKTASGFYTRFATEDDQIYSYPITFPEGASDILPTAAGEGEEEMEMDAEGTESADVSRTMPAAATSSHAEDDNKPKTKVLTSRIAKGKVSQQMMKWKKLTEGDEENENKPKKSFTIGKKADAAAGKRKAEEISAESTNAGDNDTSHGLAKGASWR